MKRPEVRLENYQAMYDFYEHYRPPKLAYQIGHRAMAAVFKPDVHFAPGAQDAIADHLRSGKRLILASNHVNSQDQYIVAAMAQREKVLRPMRGKTFIPAKESLFRNSLLRLGVDYMGAVPTFRQKDIALDECADNVIRVRATLQKKSTQKLQDMSVRRIARGDHMAIFPEGTRNTTDVTQVQSLKRGISTIGCGLEGVPVALLPTAIYYGQDEDFDKRHPTVFIGSPHESSFLQGPDVRTDLQASLQDSLDQAMAIRNDTVVS